MPIDLGTFDMTRQTFENAPFLMPADASRGELYSFEKAYEIFENQRIFIDVCWIFTKNRILAKGIRDLWGVKCPSIPQAFA